MKRNEVDDNTLVIRLKPPATLCAGLQERVGNIAQLRDGFTKLFMEMGTQVIHDVVKRSVGRECGDMLFEHADQRPGVVILGASAEDFPVFWIEKGQKVYGTITFV